MNQTGIIWTDFTWNPNSGCKEISDGCKYCYAKVLAENKRGSRAFPHGFDLTVRPHKLEEPRRLKQPALIFVNSMSDLFWEAIPDDYRDRIVDVIEDTPQHQYQVLTKRPSAMAVYARRRRLPANFWAGTTIESDRHTERAHILRTIDVPIRFLSAEPLLSALPSLDLRDLQWVITGGESGTHLCRPEIATRRALVERVHTGWTLRDDRAPWLRDIRDRCVTAGAAYFHKQHGGPRPSSAGRLLDGVTHDAFPAPQG